MSQYKLTYFNVMGLGEPIRFLLSYGGKSFEDYRVDRQNEWPNMKKNTPFGQLPLLEIDGITYAQTLPICHYLAKDLGLLGNSDLDTLQIDAIAVALHDLRKHVAVFYRETDPVIKAAKKKETLATIAPFFLDKFEELVKKNGGYLHGGKLSYADLFYAAIYDSIANACDEDPTQNRPHLRSLKEKVFAIPNIEKWLKHRPKLEF